MVRDRGVGHAKSGPTTIKLHVGGHWHLSESVGAWLDLLETSVAARIPVPLCLRCVPQSKLEALPAPEAVRCSPEAKMKDTTLG